MFATLKRTYFAELLRRVLEAVRVGLQHTRSSDARVQPAFSVSNHFSDFPHRFLHEERRDNNSQLFFESRSSQ